MRNDFGKFNYRNVEAMLTEVKEVLDKHNAMLHLTNDIIQMGDKHFIKTTATFTDCDNNYTQSSSAFAAIDFEKKGMDYSQACGAAQTYCSKYALNSLFLVDDGSADPDAQEPKDYQQPANKYAHKDAVKEFYELHPECNAKLKEKYNVSAAQYLKLEQAEEVYVALVNAGKITA